MRFPGFDFRRLHVASYGLQDVTNPWEYDLTTCTGSAGNMYISCPAGWTHIKDIPIFIHQSVGTGAGLWEINYWEYQSGTTVYLRYPLQNNYYAGAQLQLLNIARNMTITANPSTPAWNGSVGGIYVCASWNTIKVDADINLSGKGFRGAPSVSGGNQWGAQGEGYTNYNQTRAVAYNTVGGGGGQGDNNDSEGAAGGGGGNGNRGGEGAWNGSKAGGQGGWTGGNTSSDPYMVFGGGGGSGGTDNSGGNSGAGGNGGGIILLIAPNIILNANLIADGWGGGNANNDWSGGGGGGAGGTIVLIGQNIQGGTRCYARGAVGGTRPNGQCRGGSGGAGIASIYYGTGSNIVASGDTVGWSSATDFKSQANGSSQPSSVAKKSFMMTGWQHNNFSSSDLIDGGWRYKLKADAGSLVFNGTSTYVTAPMNGCVQGYYSLEAWVMVDEVRNTALVSTNTDDSNNRFNIHFPWSDGNAYYDIGNINTGGGRFYQPFDRGIIGKWAHLVCAQWDNGFRIFINGQWVGSVGGNTVRFNPAGKTLIIGANPAYSNFWKGKISELKIYNRSMDIFDATELYRGKRVYTPTHWYKFNQGTGATLTDYSGNNNHGTINNGTWSTDWAGGVLSVPKKGMSFDGVDDFVELWGTSLYSPMTTVLWFKPGKSGVVQFLFNKFNSTTSNGFFIETRETNKIRTVLRNAGTTVFDLYSNGTININKWNCVAVTMTAGGQVKIYLNGVYDNATTCASIPSETQNAKLGIFGASGDIRPFYGLMDEVLLYNRELTATEIQNLYNWTEITTNRQMKWDFADDWYNYVIDRTYWRGGYNQGAIPVTTDRLSTGANDSPNTGLYLNGSSYYLAFPPAGVANGVSALTVEAWVSIPAGWQSGDWRCIMGNIGWSDTSDWNFNFHIVDDGRVHFNVVNTSGVANGVYNTTGSVCNGVWRHLVGRYDGSTLKLYVDGVEVGSASQTGVIRNCVSKPLQVGRWHAGDTNYFNGYMKGLRIYHRALSATEIVEHRNGIFANENNLVLKALEQIPDQFVTDHSAFHRPGRIIGARWDNHNRIIRDGIRPGKRYVVRQCSQNSAGLNLGTSFEVKSKSDAGGAFLLELI